MGAGTQRWWRDGRRCKAERRVWLDRQFDLINHTVIATRPGKLDKERIVDTIDLLWEIGTGGRSEPGRRHR